MPYPNIRIGLLWHSMNSDNLGVGAMTVAHMVILREIVAGLGLSPQFRILGWRDPKPPYFTRDDIEILQLRMKDFIKPTGLYKAVGGCDIVFDIGAGDSFSDIYGKGVWKLLASQNIVMLAGKPLVLSPQTIGPFETPWIRWLALNVMRRARAVATRDALSTAFTREMGFRGPLIEATDVALRLPYEAPAPRAAGEPVKVGINVSGLLFNGGFTRDNMFGLTVDYPALMRDVLKYFHGRGDCEIHLVSHVSPDFQPVEDDHCASEILAAEFPGTIVAPAFPNPSMVKSYIAGMDFFTGARMHACIAAFSSGVPVLPMAYSRKFAGLFGTLGYGACADCKADSEEKILAKLKTAFETRNDLRVEAATAFAAGLYRLRVYEDAVHNCLAEISGVRA